jgi:four helix bundle protein
MSIVREDSKSCRRFRQEDEFLGPYRVAIPSAWPVLQHADMDCSNDVFEPGHDIRVRTFEFACRVVEFCKELYAQGGVARYMTSQLINCSTSVAASLEEARGAESRRDFISKCSIGLKEARESHVRLRVCHRTGVGPRKFVEPLIEEARQIASIIGAIVRNARRNAGIKLGTAARAKGCRKKLAPTS